jgi:hypothetical protein
VYKFLMRAPDHREVTDPVLFGAMRALGWTPEGAGVGVTACVSA